MSGSGKSVRSVSVVGDSVSPEVWVVGGSGAEGLRGSVAAVGGKVRLCQAGSVDWGVHGGLREVGGLRLAGVTDLGGSGPQMGFDALAAEDRFAIAEVGGETCLVGLVGGLVWCLVWLWVWVGASVGSLLVFRTVRVLSSLFLLFPRKAWE